MTEMTSKTRPQKYILAAALDCFNQYGIEGTTIDMIHNSPMPVLAVFITTLVVKKILPRRYLLKGCASLDNYCEIG